MAQDALQAPWTDHAGRNPGEDQLPEVPGRARVGPGRCRLPKLHAYAQRVQSRRPAKNRELKETRQAIELICFLRVSLLELTDIAVQQNLRRSQDLFREATQKVRTKRERSDSAAARSGAPCPRGATRRRQAVPGDGASKPIGCYARCWTPRRGASSPRCARPCPPTHQRVKAFLGARSPWISAATARSGFEQLEAWRELQAEGR